VSEILSPELWTTLIGPGTWETLYMIVIAVVFSHLAGVPLGIFLVITG